ncbi:MAG: c-type cytochrome domain-containing protein [Armatimonadota bacterium]|nr:c-type cytochrome domain-containing protein [Armatimonadota bacterium]
MTAVMLSVATVAVLIVGQEPVSYTKDIAPLMLKRCVACHGPDKQEDNLRLDSYEAILKGDKDGPVLIPGKSKESRLFLTLSGEREPRMPPDPFPPLPPAEIELLRRWIDAGAPADGQPQGEAGPSPAPTVRLRLPLTLPTPVPEPHFASIALPPLPPVTALAFDPEGQILAQANGNRIVVWDVQKALPATQIRLSEGLTVTGLFIYLMDGGAKGLGAHIRKPDGSSSLEMFSLPLGQKVGTVTEGAWRLTASSPDARRLALAAAEGRIALWDPSAQKEIASFQAGDGAVKALSLGAQGRIVAILTEKGDVQLFEGDAKGQPWQRISLTTLAEALPAESLALHPTEPQLALLKKEPSGGRLFLFSLTPPKRLEQVAVPETMVGDLSWSFDGKVLAGRGQRQVMFWSPGSAPVIASVGPDAEVATLAIHPSGAGAAIGRRDGSVMLLDRQGVSKAVLVETGDGRWLIATAFGYWAGRAGDLISWEGSLLPQDKARLADAWRQPDRVAQVVRFETVSPAPLPAK